MPEIPIDWACGSGGSANTQLTVPGSEAMKGDAVTGGLKSTFKI